MVSGVYNRNAVLLEKSSSSWAAPDRLVFARRDIPIVRAHAAVLVQPKPPALTRMAEASTLQVYIVGVEA